MKKVTKEFEVYKFDELGEDARGKVVNEHLDYLLSIDWDNEEYVPDFVEQGINKAKELKQFKFAGAYIYEFGEVYIESELEEHEYLINGERFYN